MISVSLTTFLYTTSKYILLEFIFISHILRVVQRGVRTKNFEVRFSVMWLRFHDDSYLDHADYKRELIRPGLTKFWKSGGLGVCVSLSPPWKFEPSGENFGLQRVQEVIWTVNRIMIMIPKDVYHMIFIICLKSHFVLC